MFEAFRDMDSLLEAHTRKAFKKHHGTVDDKLAIIEVDREDKEKVLLWVLLGVFFGIAFTLVPGVKRVDYRLRFFVIVCIGLYLSILF